MTPRFTATEKLAEIDRELRLRRHVYPSRVAAGKLGQKVADRQIALLEAIRADYMALAEKERLL
jgi:hypothetical protein